MALTAAAEATSTPARRQRHLPGHRARPDHDRQGGRLGRSPLRRPPRVRGRRRLEPRGDGQPRHRPADADAPDAGAHRGDEGDLDRRTRPATTVSSSTSTASGHGPSPRSARTRRCSSAATGRPWWTACSTSATPGSPTGPAPACSTRVDGAARPRRPADRHDGHGPARRSGGDRALHEAGCRRVRALDPVGESLVVEQGTGALGGGDRAGHRRGVTPAEARERFAAARVARLATADAGGRPHLVPVVFAVRRGLRLQRRGRQAQAHDGAAAAGQRRREPGAWRCWPTTTTRTGARCGGCAPTGSGVCSSRGRASRPRVRRPRARSTCCGRATPSSARWARCWRSTSSAGAAGRAG